MFAWMRRGVAYASVVSLLPVLVMLCFLAPNGDAAPAFPGVRSFTGGADGAPQKVAALPVTYAVLHTFAGFPVDGSYVYGGLLRDAAGNLYGTASQGGASGFGTVYKTDPAGKETVLHSFDYFDGEAPYGSLIEDSSGNFFGTTEYGGEFGDGEVFKLDPAGNLTVLHSFAGFPLDGAYPVAALVEDAAGNLYGTTVDGGGTGEGIVFKLDPSGNETIVLSFGGVDGANPSCTLFRDSAGNLYGTTEFGGQFSQGTVFEITPDGGERVLYNFPGLTGGAQPESGVLLDARGNLYGTTHIGGNLSCPQGDGEGCGVVFELTPKRQAKILYAFNGTTDGALPYAGLLRDRNGYFYGTTSAGGRVGYGTIFRVSAAGQFQLLHALNGVKDGGVPVGGLVTDGKGSFYGTSYEGGGTFCGCGTVFQLTPAN